MKKKRMGMDSIIVGLALFSTMFGAGNLIFPPQIGLTTGTQWYLGAIGIVLTGVVLPVLAFWGVNNVGDVRAVMGYVHPKFYDWFYLIGCILVGMGSTLPRSGATTHEMGVMSIFPNAPHWVTMIIFFALVFFFGCDHHNQKVRTRVRVQPFKSAVSRYIEAPSVSYSTHRGTMPDSATQIVPLPMQPFKNG